MDISNLFVEIDGDSVELKYCKKCDQFKEINDFYMNEDVCKRCSTKLEDRREYYKRLIQTEEGRTLSRKWKESDPERWSEYMRKYVKENPDKVKVYGHNRRAKERALPFDFNGKQWTEIIERFNGTCAISNSKEFVLEHVIPLAWGHGGTHINNVVPMDASLNGSKSARNIFEWVKRPDIQARVDMEKFEDLIARMAFLNDMSSLQYREYVYWCEANKRTLEEIKGETK